jgi:GNAT superfamily N-acetyltransferase
VSQENDESKISRVGRVATERDVPAVVACLASAFYDDPVWGHWTSPEQASRHERLHALMHAWTAAAVRHGWVWMTDNAEAVAVWTPPGKPEMTEHEQARLTTRMSELMADRADQLADLFDQFEVHHPKELHYYLGLWGTHRDHAGRGIGTALIRDNLARIDTAGMPAYLESTNPANLSRYEALGFKRTGEFGPVNGPVITTMWRKAVGLEE